MSSNRCGAWPRSNLLSGRFSPVQPLRRMRVPFGFRRGDEGELIPHEAEQEAIREMVALRAQGKALRTIADTARAEGSPDQPRGRGERPTGRRRRLAKWGWRQLARSIPIGRLRSCWSPRDTELVLKADGWYGRRVVQLGKPSDFAPRATMRSPSFGNGR